MDKDLLKLEDKKFLAHKADRAANTEKLAKSLDPVKEATAKMAGFLEQMKGDKGDTPVKGKDYYTEQEAQDFLQKATPEKGVHYFTPEEIGQFKQDVTPVKGVHYNDGEPGKPGKDGKESIVPGPPGESIKGDPGNPGKDGSPDTAEQIVKKLSSLKDTARLHINSVQGLEEFEQKFNELAKGFVPRSLDSLFDVAVRGVIADGQSLIWNAKLQKWIPGSASGSGSLAVETPTGAKDGVNTSFGVTYTPVFITNNGQVLTGSGVDYTYSAGTITLVNAPFSTDILRSYHN